MSISPSLYEALFTAETDQALRQLGDVVFQKKESRLSEADLARQISGFDVIVTGWGTPRFSDPVLDAADRLKLIAHSAGSIKNMLPPPVFERGMQVTHAAAAIAPAVADMTLLLMMLCLRRVHKLDPMLKANESWAAAREIGMGQELTAQRVGVVGAGYTGQQIIAKLRALGVETWVYDPYLTPERAAELDVRKAELDELLTESTVVTLQAPPTKETYRMIGPRELRLLQDNAIFINTARAHLVDEAALIAELRTGRIQAALDVYDKEPLPDSSPFRDLDNVILTPHVAGATIQSRERQGQITVDEIRRFLNDEPLQYRVTGSMLETMA